MPTTNKIPDGRPYRVRFFGSPFPGKMDDIYPHGRVPYLNF